MERLGYRPGLDGLRAVAVAMVMATHLGGGRHPWAGTLGVLVFFVLSGFLITKLLLEEQALTGRIDRRAFYVRRARRLLPALPFALVGCALVTWHVGGPILAPVLASSFYVQNIMVGLYDQDGSFNHFWSLALEEQFYLLWPLLLVGLPRLRTACAWALPIWLALKIQVAGTPLGAGLREAGVTMIDGLLVGAWLAFVAQSKGLPRLHWPVAVAAASTLAAVGFTPGRFPVENWGLSIGVVASAVLVVWACGLRRAPAPLVWVGVRSYAIYLWHVPLSWIIGHNPVSVAAILVVAECSWRWVESPARRSGRLRHQEPDDPHVTGHGVIRVRPIALGLQPDHPA